MSRKFLTPFLMTIALILAAVLPSAAAEIFVTNLNDSGSGSLRQAIADAAPGDTVVIDFPYIGTIPLTSGELVINKDLTITGPGKDWLQISGNNVSRIFTVSSGATVLLSGMKVVNGSVSGTSGGGIYNDGSLTIQSCSFLQNSMIGSSISGGGAIYSSPTGNLTLNDCEFSDNTADALDRNFSYLVFGGAVFAEGALTVQDCNFVGNRALAYQGGAITASGFSNALVTITGSTFEINSAAYGAGAVYILGQEAIVSRCQFISNMVSGVENVEGFYGGAIHTIYSALTVVNSTFSGNQVIGPGSAGGGIYSYGVTNAINCTFANNIAGSQGGGFAGFYYTMRLDNCILWENYAPFGSQVTVQYFGIPGYDGGEITVANCDVQGGVIGLNGVVDGGGNIDEDPQFVINPYDNPPGDLHLLAGSPCINAGNANAVPLDVATDLDGNTRIVGDSVDMGAYESQITDTTAPTLTWGSLTPAPNAAGWNNTPVEIPFTTMDDLSGVAPSSPTGPLYFGSEGASQTQEVTVTDNAGNSETFLSPIVNIDMTPPTTSDAVAGTTFTLSASDNLSQVKATYYKVNGGAQQTYTSPFALSLGFHEVQYWSVDNADNVEEVKTLTVDTRSAVTVAVANASGRSGGKVKLSATVTQTNNGAKLEGKAVTFMVNGVFVGNATTNRQGIATLSYTIPTNFSIGTYDIWASSNPDGTHKSGFGTGTLTVKR